LIEEETMEMILNEAGKGFGVIDSHE